jgi:hypothetical protein
MFLLIECKNPDRVSVLPLDSTEANPVRVCIAGDEADIANYCDGLIAAECVARHAAKSGAPVAPLSVSECVMVGH